MIEDSWKVLLGGSGGLRCQGGDMRAKRRYYLGGGSTQGCLAGGGRVEVVSEGLGWRVDKYFDGG